MPILYLLLLFMLSTVVHAEGTQFLYNVEGSEKRFTSANDACSYASNFLVTGASEHRLQYQTDLDAIICIVSTEAGAEGQTKLTIQGEKYSDSFTPQERSEEKRSTCNADTVGEATFYAGIFNDTGESVDNYPFPNSFGGCVIEITEVVTCWTSYKELEEFFEAPAYCDYAFIYTGAVSPKKGNKNPASNSNEPGAVNRYETTEKREDGTTETIKIEEVTTKNADGSLLKITSETHILNHANKSKSISSTIITKTKIEDKSKEDSNSAGNTDSNSSNGGWGGGGENNNSSNGGQGSGGTNSSGSSGGQSGGGTNNNGSSGGQSGSGTNSNGSSGGQSGGATNSNGSSGGQSGGGTNNNGSSGDQDGGATDNNATDGQNGSDTNNQNPDLENLCKSNPNLTLCKESKITVNCTSFSCEGDAIQCAMIRLQYENACRTQEDRTSLAKAPYTSLGDQLLAGRDPLQDRLPTPQNGKTISLGKLDNSGFLGSAQCLQDKNLVVAGQTIVIPLSGSCQYFLILRLVIMATASLVAMRIITGAVRR